MNGIHVLMKNTQTIGYVKISELHLGVNWWVKGASIKTINS